MRKITGYAAYAFEHGFTFKGGNTRTVPDDDGRLTIFLHGNPIARRVDGGYEITDAGWATATTKERLNGLSRVHIEQRKGSWYLNGSANPWDGNWTFIPFVNA